MKKTQLLGLVAAAVLSTPTFAITYGSSGGSTLQGVLDGITQTTPSNPTGMSSIDVTSDFLNDSSDTYWAINGSGGAVNTIIVELAGFKDQTTFGIYDPGTDQHVEIFDGAASAGDLNKTLSILLDGSVLIGGVDTGKDFDANRFNFYLDSSAGNIEGYQGGLFYSDTTLNSDGVDHMAAFQGQGDTVQIDPYAPGIWGANEYILAWEDLYGGGDADYSDFVVMVESISPVPAPATLALMGIGLLGLVGTSRRRKTKA